jgi:hypothetical protein
MVDDYSHGKLNDITGHAHVYYKTHCLQLRGDQSVKISRTNHVLSSVYEIIS